MEKQRIKPASKFGKRLLIALAFVFLFYANAYSQNSYTFEPEAGQNFYVNDNIKFTVIIPNVRASQVQVNVPAFKENINFKNMNKSENLGEEGGTKIEIWYSFSKKGYYQIPRLPLTIQGKSRSAVFPRIRIKDNPANMSPRAVIVFSNGKEFFSDEPADFNLNVKTGEKLIFTIYLQYATQLINFNWEIPKESIFKQTKVYEITEIRYREKQYTDSYIPVSTFEWFTLAEGKIAFPKIRITATSYDGYKTDILFPEFFINSQKGFAANESQSQDKAFAQAFEKTDEARLTAKEVVVTYDDCVEISRLRSKEKFTISGYSKIKKERKAEEKRLNLPSDKNEFSKGILYLYAVLLFASLLILFIAIRKKQMLPVMIFALVSVGLATQLLYSAVQFKKKYGIFTGGTLKSIPEEKASGLTELPAGSRVQISEETAGWYFVELSEQSGWCLKDNVILINGE